MNTDWLEPWLTDEVNEDNVILAKLIVIIIFVKTVKLLHQNVYLVKLF